MRRNLLIAGIVVAVGLGVAVAGRKKGYF